MPDQLTVKYIVRHTAWDKILTNPEILGNLKQTFGAPKAIKVCRDYLKSWGEPELLGLDEEVRSFLPELPPVTLMSQKVDLESRLEYVRRFIKENESN